VVSGDGNIIEANTAIGNANGIVVFGVATNNQVRQNVAVGNPPIQQSNSVPGGAGVDLWDQSPPTNHNTFLGNLCVTAINAPCPTVGTQAVPRKPGS
jgi:parallel beta-helix repeat protein